MPEDTALYTYGFCWTPAQTVSLPLGIQDALKLVTEDDLAALVEPDHFFDAVSQDDKRLMRAVLTHDRVLCDWFGQLPVLPLRFGTRFVSEASLREHLRTNRDRYRQTLQALADKAEYQLKLHPQPINIPTPASELKGRDYFLAKKQRLQAQNQAQQAQIAELSELTAAIAQAYPKLIHDSPRDGIERLYLLISRDQASTLQQYCQRWQQHTQYWQIALSDALPPYHFI
ncbi:MAG: GvpL/GvpF family gas vesicle protein [Cyanobacteria bacterium J06635_15]